MQHNKQRFAKKYIAILLTLSITSIILCTFTGIGYFTSQKDDDAYISVIKSDIAMLKAQSTNGDYLKINKLTETGVFYMYKDDTTINFLQPHSLSQVKLKSESNKPKSSFITNDFENSIKNKKLVIEYEDLKNTKFLKETSLFSSFGNVFSYRLYPLVQKIFVNMIEFVSFDGFVMVILDEESVRVSLYEDNGSVSALDYWFRKEKELPPVKDVMKHMLCRMKMSK